MVRTAIWESEIRCFQGYPCAITEYLEVSAREGISVSLTLPTTSLFH